MRYIILLFVALLYLPTSAQTSDFVNRKSEIEACTANIYSVTEFKRVADSLQLSIDELCNYPVISPIKKMQNISSGFGWRRHPIRRTRQFHMGIDIPKTKGTAVYATGNGVVVRKGYDSGYGNYIEIQHAGGFRSFYAHLSRSFVYVGDWVSITEQIACVGNTGLSTGAHLHYEIRKGNRYLNPAEWCYVLFDILQ